MAYRENRGIDERSMSGSDQSGFENLVDELPMGILSCDMEGNITAVNDFLLEILGSPSANATKKINMLTFPPLVGSGISVIIEEALATGNSTSIKTSYRSKWGKELFLSFKVFPLKEEDGSIYGCHTIVEDLTDKRVADETIEQNKLKDRLLSNISDRFINSSYKEIDEDINRTLKDLADFIGADRVTLFTVDESTDFIIKTYEWHAEGIKSKIEFNEKWDTKKIVFEKLNDLQIVNIPDVNNMPEEKGYLQKKLQSLGIRSIAMIPLSHENKFSGFVGIDSKRENCNWKEKDLYTLKVAGNMISNILERKNTEEMLLKKEQEYKDVIDSVDSILWKAIFDMNGNILETSILNPVDKVLDLPEGAIGTDWDSYFAHIHPDDQLKVYETFNRSFIQPDTPIDQDYRLVADDGRIVWVNSIGTSALQSDGTFLSIGTTVNITPRKIAEEDLRESEERFKALHNASFGGIAIHDKGRILDCNLGLSEITGYSQEELAGMDGLLLIAESHRDIVMANIIAGYEKPYEAMGRRKNGSEYPLRLEARNVPYKGRQVRVVEFRDITERKKAEEEKKQIQDRLLLATQAGGVGIWDYDVVNDNLVWDEQMFNLYGVSSNAFNGAYEAWKSGIHPDDIEQSDKEVQMALRGEKEFDTEFRVVWPDGTIRNIRAMAIVQRDESGDPVRMIGTNWDITKQKEAEEKLRLFIEQAPVSLIMLDRNMKYIAISPSTLNYFSIYDQEIIGKNHYDTFPAFDNEYYRAVNQRALKGEVVRKEEDRFELPDGTTYWIRWEVRPWKESDGTIGGIIIFFDDITERKMAQDKLRENEALLTEVGRIANIGGWEFDISTGKGTWTPEVAKIHELDPLTPTDVELGLSFYPPVSRELIEKAIHDAVQKSEPYNLELELITAKGTHKWVRTIGNPIIKDDKVVKVTGSLQDITERKEVEKKISRSEAKYRSLFERSNDAIMIQDIKGKILEANEMACELFGYCEEDLKQRSIVDLTIPEDRGETRSRMTGISKERHCRRDIRMLRSDGSIIYADVSATFLEAEQDLIQVVARDITDRIKAEEVMLTAKIEAETASRTKSEFLANMSHELRTPLNSIIGFSEMILYGIAGELEPKQEHYAQHISNSGHHLLNIINDILDISKIEAGKMELHCEMLDIRTSIDEIVYLTHTLIVKKNITVNVNVPGDLPEMMVDRSKIKQVLYNLVGNAIKFTNRSGEIKINAEFRDGDLRISVIDTGIGISPEDQNKLFKPFSQIDSSTSRKYEGTGLGLALVKEIIELHKGRIWVESESGKGSSFIFELPLQHRL